MKRIILLMISVIVATGFSTAQVNDFVKHIDGKLFYSASETGWVKFNNNLTVLPEKVFEQYGASFGLVNGFGMRLIKTNIGTNGYTHYKFQQTFNEADVTDGHFIIHAQYAKIISGNGKIFTPAFKKNAVSITENTALAAALKTVNAITYAWQNPLKEQRLKQKTKNPAATYFPKATTAYWYQSASGSLRLTYKFFINTMDAGLSCICYVDASSGTVLEKITTEYNCDITTVNTNWYGTQIFFTNDVGIIGSNYDLEDDCTPSVFSVYNGALPGDVIYNTLNNQWVTDEYRSAATTLWGIRKTYDQYSNFFGRNGHDNDGGDMAIYQGFDFGTGGMSNPNNASYSYDGNGNSELKFGTGSTASVLDDWNTVDIVAHEYTHGVTQFEASLVYAGESGALNESFSDIFGEFFEGRILGVTDWFVGKDRKFTNGAPSPIRSFANPAATNVSIDGYGPYNFNDPNTYQGTNWLPVACTPSAANDNCGVHTNSGVQNHMAYLLAVGGNGWNNGLNSHAPANSGYQWSVSGIGIEKMIKIAYKALCDYMGPNSTHLDARNAWVLAAIELYGECSIEANQTGKAWYAVGIAPPAGASNNICGTFGLTPFTYTKSGNINIATNCTVGIITNNNSIQFISGSKITIGPNFSALNGSRFAARINRDCFFSTF
ncbi:MAG: M4 family metallopeptidase [Chitinophagaceae bacterium]|nr:M4 family metallopeptidase [Chitinophagaceae bacterium]